jgi:lysophospholipase L1-like esterase
MKLLEKLKMNRDELVQHGPINIVAYGDSVTHGGFAGAEVDQEAVYHNLLKKRILQISSYVPVNVINAGIGGLTAAQSLERMERQVFSHSPDLVIVSFGLNDINGPLEEYLTALRTIFGRCKEYGVDAIFMTPNMLNTYSADDTYSGYKEYSYKTAEMQNSGRMDLYMENAVKLATEMGITLCDCYAKWKKISETEDTTMLLANRINHPTKEMHKLFAESLFELIFPQEAETSTQNSSTMFGNN